MAKQKLITDGPLEHVEETDLMIPKTDDIPAAVENTPSGRAMIRINRPAYNQDALVNDFALEEVQAPSCSQKTKTCCHDNCSPNRECIKAGILGFLPFISIFRNYKWKKWIVADIVSGLSVGVIHIPQGMGFALLTSLPPVYGLYSSLWPVLVYFFFASSRHNSMGTMALISLMIGTVVNDQLRVHGPFTNATAQIINGTLGEDPEITFKVDIAMSVSLLVGAFQLLMGLFRLGIIATFMSMPFVGGFLVGAAVHIITSQIPSILQLTLPPVSEIFKIPLTYYEIFKSIGDTNPGSVTVGLICITILFVLKEVINVKCQHRLKVPIPAELIILILATLISHYARFEERYNIAVIGSIRSGLPAPTVPSMTNAGDYVGSAFLIAIVSFAICITMAKLMSRKHKYPLDTNQELLAYGLAHGVGSFLFSFAGAQAPPRTLVHDSIGGKTQLGSLVSCVLVLVTCMWIGPLFQSLPKSALAAIIIVALLPLFRQFKDLKPFWKVNKYDFLVWVITFGSAVILSIPLGLAIGISASIIFVVIHGHLVHGHRAKRLGTTDLYTTDRGRKSGKMYDVPNIKIFCFGSPLYFVNVEKFKQQLFAATVNPQSLAEQPLEKVVADKQSGERGSAIQFGHAEHADDISLNGEPNSEGVVKLTDDIDLVLSDGKKEASEIPNDGKEIRSDDTSNEQKTAEEDTPDCRFHRLPFHTLVIDCSAISYIDVMGLAVLKAIRAEFRGVDIQVVFAHCSDDLIGKFVLGDVTVADNREDIFATIHDAVTFAQNKFTTCVTAL